MNMNHAFVTAILLAVSFLAPCTGRTATPTPYDDDDNPCPIFVGVVQMEPAETGVSQAVKMQIQTRLCHAIARWGFVDTDLYPQFFVAARLEKGFYDILSNGQHVLKADLSLYLGDRQTKTVFASETFPVKGVGASQERAAIKAIGSLDTHRQQLRDFVQQGREKILAYYDKEYPRILAHARQAAAQRDFDEAFYLIGMIPECCRGYDEAQRLTDNVWKEQATYKGQKAIDEARNEWAAHPDAQGAEKAFELLAEIDPDTPSYAEARELAKTIGSRVQTQYDFENIQKYRDSLEADRHRVDAIRDAAIAYGSHQPQETTEIDWIK